MNKNGIKEFLRQLMKYTYVYRRELNAYNESVDKERVYSKILRYIKTVPYYACYDTKESDISKFPIIRKCDIQGKEDLLVSRKVLKRFMSKEETGGTTGVSLELFYSISTRIKKQVYSDIIFDKVGGSNNVAMLRGKRPNNGALAQRINKKLLLLSSYLISEDTIDEYVSIIKREKISVLHVYPTAIYVLSKCIKGKFERVEFPDLKGIVSSSEILSKEIYSIVKDVFPKADILDYYGHNELVCCAYSLNGASYVFPESFGHVEFIPTGDTINNHIVAEIVATSIMNEDMPFIRYATDDYVELDEKGNVISIIGRGNDFVVNKRNEIVPCIISLNPKSHQNVINFQYYQPSVGVLKYRIQVDENYDYSNQRYLLEDLETSFAGNMDCEIVVVDQIEKTKAGKQKRLIQSLDIDKYR